MGEGDGLSDKVEEEANTWERGEGKENGRRGKMDVYFENKWGLGWVVTVSQLWQEHAVSPWQQWHDKDSSLQITPDSLQYWCVYICGRVFVHMNSAVFSVLYFRRHTALNIIHFVKENLVWSDALWSDCIMASHQGFYYLWIKLKACPPFTWFNGPRTYLGI